MAESIPKRRGGSRFGGLLVTQDMSEDICPKGQGVENRVLSKEMVLMLRIWTVDID